MINISLCHTDIHYFNHKVFQNIHRDTDELSSLKLTFYRIKLIWHSNIWAKIFACHIIKFVIILWIPASVKHITHSHSYKDLCYSFNINNVKRFVALTKLKTDGISKSHIKYSIAFMWYLWCVWSSLIHNWVILRSGVAFSYSIEFTNILA